MADYFTTGMRLYLDHLVDWKELLEIRGGGAVDVDAEVGAYRTILETASALAASISDPSVFRSGRELAAWIGLVPRQTSTGGKARLGRISKAGDHYLRWLLVAGAMTVIRHGRRSNFEKNPWLGDLMARKPTKLAAVALANKNARTAWALLANGGTYRQTVLTTA